MSTQKYQSVKEQLKHSIPIILKAQQAVVEETIEKKDLLDYARFANDLSDLQADSL